MCGISKCVKLFQQHFLPAFIRDCQKLLAIATGITLVIILRVLEIIGMNLTSGTVGPATYQ